MLAARFYDPDGNKVDVYKTDESDNDSTLLTITNLVNSVFSFCANHKDSYIGFDFETNGLEPLLDSPLLLALGCKETCICINCTIVDLKKVFPSNYQDYIFIGHNIKFDIAFAILHFDLHIKNIFDTMLASQKIHQNLPTGFSLVRTYEIFVKGRPDLFPELKDNYAVFDKSARKAFIGVDPKRFNPNDVMVEYALGDIRHLHDIMKGAKQEAERLDLLWFLENVEFPLSYVLAKAESRGVSYDTPGLIDYIKELKDSTYDTVTFLDKEAQRINDLRKDTDDYFLAKGGAMTRPRNKQSLPPQYDLFGNRLPPDTIFTGSKAKKPGPKLGLTKVVYNTANINYNSEKDITEVFARIGQCLPTKDGLYLIPHIVNNKIVEGVGRVPDFEVRVGNTVMEFPTTVNNIISCGKFTTNKTALLQMIQDNPHFPTGQFIQKLIEYRGNVHLIAGFGNGILEKIHNGRIYTSYRQIDTANGRLSSGERKNTKDDYGEAKSRGIRINSQNQPRNNKLRNRVIAARGNRMLTTDLSGAEVTIIADKAGDKVLYQLAVVQDDAHSPIITNSWRAIFAYRAGKAAGEWNNAYGFKRKFRKRMLWEWLKLPKDSEVYKQAELATTFIVDRKQNSAYRQGGKNATFGSIYGMNDKKAMETYNGTTSELRRKDPKAEAVNVTLDEASVALYAIKQFIPKPFEFAEECVKKALLYGYLELNSRSKTKVWFKPVLEALAEVRRTIQELQTEYGITAVLESVDSKRGAYTLSTGDEILLDRRDLEDVAGQARNLPISGTQAEMIKESMVRIDAFVTENNLPMWLVFQIHDELVTEATPTEVDLIYKSPSGKEIRITDMKDIDGIIMADTCSLYMKNFTMGYSVTDKECWSK